MRFRLRCVLNGPKSKRVLCFNALCCCCYDSSLSLSYAFIRTRIFGFVSVIRLFFFLAARRVSPRHIQVRSFFLVVITRMPPLSEDVVKRQNEWMAQLGGTVDELQSVAEQACRHHEGYLAALSRMGELYAYCGRLMVQTNTPILAIRHQVDDATEARKVAAQLKLSIEQWRDSADVRALRTFLKNQKEQWQMWGNEVKRAFEHNKERQRHCHAMEVLRKNVKRVEKVSLGAAREQKYQLTEVEAARTAIDTQVLRDIEENAKLCSRDLIKFGTEFIDSMSNSGQVCALSFQPIGFDGADLSSTRRTGTRESWRNMPTETVLGVVLHRPSSREAVDDSTEGYGRD